MLKQTENNHNSKDTKKNQKLCRLNLAYKIFVAAAIITAIILLIFLPCNCPCNA